ncbi:MAG: hypothetical protein ACTS3F_04375 [Phycisphaerales bacterium]
MKPIAYLIMALSVALGAISAATAYFVPIDANNLPTEKPLELAANAGVYDPAQLDGRALEQLETRIANIRDAQAERRAADETHEPLVRRDPVSVDLPEVPTVEGEPSAQERIAESEALRPVARKGDLLDEQMIALLRDRAEVGLVKVTTFNPGIWLTMWQSWLFLASIVMLTASALVIRTVDARAHRREAAEEREHRSPADPRVIAENISSTVRALMAELQRTPRPGERVLLIVERLGAIQRDDVPAFAAARPVLITRFGLGGFAEIMDVFAAAERQINRAWSAAADNVEAEAIDALDRARAILPALEERLASK